LPAARGENSESLALALMANAANAATPQVRMRLLVFILIFLSVWVALHCSTRLLSLSYPGKLKTPQEFSSPGH
jgi:hypothetical protein